MRVQHKILWTALLIASLLGSNTAHAAPAASAYTPAPQGTPSAPSHAGSTTPAPETLPGWFVVKFKGPEMGGTTLQDLVKELQSLNLQGPSFVPVFKSGRPFSYSSMAEALRGDAQYKARRAKRIASFTTRLQRAPKKLRTSSSLERVYLAEVPQGQKINAVLSVLSRHPGVEYVQPVYHYDVSESRSVRPFNDPLLPELWGMNRIQAPAAWKIAQGQNVTVAVVDTGIQVTHEDLSSNIWVNRGEIPDNCIDDDGNGLIDDSNGYDFTENPRNGRQCDGAFTFNKVDDFVGHGTHVAGTIAAAGNNAVGVVGVAPKARLMAAKGLDENGGSSVALALAIAYAVENGADILNNSWGSKSGAVDPLVEDVLAEAHNVGVLSVFAMGNSTQVVGPNSFLARGTTFNVAASDPSDSRATFSNYGPYTHVAAPGVAILSTASRAEVKSGAPYAIKQGTSMACPHVAGVAALVLSLNPLLKTEALQAVLQKSTDDVGQEGYDEQVGFGIINAQKALQLTQAVREDAAALPTVKIVTPVDNSTFSALSDSQTVAIQVARSGDLKNTTLEYRSKDDSGAAWMPITLVTGPDSNTMSGHLPLRALSTGTYEIRATVESSRFELTARHSVEISVDLPGIVTAGRLTQGWLDPVSIDISDSHLSWNTLKRINNKWQWSIQAIDLAQGTQRELPIPAANEHILGPTFAYYLDATVFGTSTKGNESCLHRYNVSTGEDTTIDFTRFGGRFLGFCATLHGYDDRVVWFKDLENIRTLNLHSPVSGMRTLMTSDVSKVSLRQPRIVGNSVLVIKREGTREKLIRIDATTGVPDSTPLLDEEIEFGMFLSKSDKEKLLVMQTVGDIFQLQTKIFEYNDVDKSVRFLVEKPLVEASLTSNAMMSIEGHELTTGHSSVISTSLEDGSTTPVSISNNRKERLDSQSQHSVWVETTRDGSSLLKLHSQGTMPRISPTFTYVGPQTTKERIALTFTVAATNSRGGTLLYDAKNLPQGATVAAASGVFMWTPKTSDVGTHTIEFIAYDPADSSNRTTMEVPISVVKNNPPMIDDIPAQTAFVGSPFKFCPAIYDIDLEQLSVDIRGLPQGASFSQTTKCIEWNPTEDQGGHSYTVEILASDTLDAASKRFQLVVEGPQVDLAIADLMVNPPAAFLFDLVLAYANDPIQFQPLVINQGARISNPIRVRVEIDDGRIWSTEISCSRISKQQSCSSTSQAWKPKAGSYTLKITVDPDNAQREVDESNNVLEVPLWVEAMNHEPTLVVPTTIQSYGGSPLRFNIEVGDLDDDQVVVALEQAPPGATILNGREFLWSPQENQIGTHVVRIRATDSPATGSPLSVVKESTITVVPVPKTAPAAPAGLTGKVSSDPNASGRFSVTLNWKDLSGDESSFVPEVAIGGGSMFSSLSAVGANATGSVVNGLHPNNGYIFRVCSVNIVGRTCSVPIKVPILAKAGSTLLAETPRPAL